MDEKVRLEMWHCFEAICGIGVGILVITCIVIWWKGREPQRELRRLELEALDPGLAEQGRLPRRPMQREQPQKGPRDYEPVLRFGRDPCQKWPARKKFKTRQERRI